MKYVIGALVVLALLFAVWWVISRARQQKLDQQRAEAASIRAGAEDRAATIRGQETFAQHADERAAVARHEAEERARLAEESAREAQRVEQEARAHQSELERARLERDAELRRADELDPDVDVDANDPRPLPDDLDDHVRPLDAASTGDATSTGDAAGAGDAAGTGDGTQNRSSGTSAAPGDGDMVIIDDVEDYASSEPLPMEEQTPETPKTPDATNDDDASRAERVSDAELLGGGDDTVSRTEGGDATHWPDGTERVSAADDSSDSTDDRGSNGTAPHSGARGRRISEVDEIRDGGFGVGSAAPFEDRAQPLEHPVQAYRDTMTYRAPGVAGYDSAEPDVWFYDEESARRAGFAPSEG